jgi:hypothetical protein
VLNFHHPDKLKDKLDLDIPDKPLTLDQLLEDCRDALKYGVKTGTPSSIGGSTVVEQSPHHLKVKGLSLAITDGVLIKQK